MDISLLVHDYQPSGMAVKGSPGKRASPLKGVDDAAFLPPPPEEKLPMIREAVMELPTPADINRGTPSPVPSSPLSDLSRTPSLSPPPADGPADHGTVQVAAGPAVRSRALQEAAKKPKTKTAIEARREQVRLAEVKAELARVYKTEDRTRTNKTPNAASPSKLPPLSPSLAAGPFVRYMARVYLEDIEDVRIQRYLRDKVMTTAHFNEMMIWHRRALKERSRNAVAVQSTSNAAPSPGTATPDSNT